MEFLIFVDAVVLGFMTAQRPALTTYAATTSVERQTSCGPNCVI